MSNEAIRAVRVERLRAVYRQLPLTLGASVVNALITAVVLAPRVGRGPLAVWLVAFALMVLLRIAARRQFFRLDEDAMLQPFWSRMAVAGSLASGMLWGACGLFLMPLQPPYPLFVAFVIGGMCAGAITVNGAHLPSVIAFILPAVLPLAGRFAWHGGTIAFAMALMTTGYAGALALAAWSSAREFAAGVRGRVALAERTAELAAANARLHIEIAERESAEAAMHQAQKMEAIGRLTAGMAHDVNNVLTVVRGAAEALKQRLAYAPAHQRQANAILRATDRGAAMTRQLLAFARKEALKPDAVDLNAALRATATLLEATLGASIRLVLDLDEALPPALVDRTGFEQAIINLAINARDAMPEGGTLTFGTSLDEIPRGTVSADLPAGRYAVVSVADSGIGMTAPVLAQAFEPFFTTKPPGKGSGLGLSQVYGFIRQSGGAVRIESAPGTGTTILLHLPLAETARPQANAAAEPPPAARTASEHEHESPHLVLLDDEDLVRETIAELLEGAGYRVSAFARAVDALRCVETDPDVVMLVTALGLADRGGNDVARMLRQVRPDLPVVFIAGDNAAREADGEPWLLRKPFAEGELLAIVARALQQRSTAA